MNRLDNELKSILSNHESTVPHDAWENIKDGLVEDNANRYLLFYWMTGLLVIALISLLAFKLIDGNPASNDAELNSINMSEVSSLDDNSYLIPLETDMLRFDDRHNDDVNNLVITKSSFKNTKVVEVEDSSFIKNLKAIKEIKK